MRKVVATLTSKSAEIYLSMAGAKWLWRPRFLISIINANDRISHIQPADNWSNLGQPGSSPWKPRQQTLLNPLNKSTHPCGRPLVKDTVEPRMNPDVGECLPELLPRSPNFT
jgi:hypothetical protein